MSKDRVINRLKVPKQYNSVHVTSTVDDIVVKRLEMLGVDIPEYIRRTLNEAAGHHVCPTCKGLLKPRKKKA